MASISFTLADTSVHGELGAALAGDPLAIGGEQNGALHAVIYGALAVLPEAAHGVTGVKADVTDGVLALRVDTTLTETQATEAVPAVRDAAPTATEAELKRSAVANAGNGEAPVSLMFGTTGPVTVPAVTGVNDPVPEPQTEPEPVSVTEPVSDAHDNAVAAAQDSAAIAADSPAAVAAAVVAQALDDVNKALEQWPDSEALKGAKVELQQFTPPA